MGEPKNHPVHDFGIFEHFLEPPNQHYLFFEAPGFQKKTRKAWNLLKNVIAINIIVWKPKVLTIFENMGTGNR